jgi:hypothetical protein
MQNNNQQPTKLDSPLFDRVATILEQARANVVRSVNSEMVIAYWLVGGRLWKRNNRARSAPDMGSG